MIRIIKDGKTTTVNPTDGKDITLAIWDVLDMPQAKLAAPAAAVQKVGEPA